MRDTKIRLCLDQPLGAGQSVLLAEGQAHYLFGVMRLDVGARIMVFNGRDGEWLAEVTEARRKRGALRCIEQLRPQQMPPDLWLVFAPVKKARTDVIVEKAVELGTARLLPVLTDHTNSERFRRDKAEAHVREAAEQCGALWLPPVEDAQPLSRLLQDWPEGRTLFWADESRAGARDSFSQGPDGPAGILIGPEGGFSPAERARLAELPFVHPVSLGPRILRAETAAIAALTLWQATHGDWR